MLPHVVFISMEILMISFFLHVDNIIFYLNPEKKDGYFFPSFWRSDTLGF